MSTSSSLSASKAKSALLAYARSLGFERVGVTRAHALVPEEDYLKSWIREGRAGSMRYMEKDPEQRARPQKLLPGARSVIALAMSYVADDAPAPASGEGLGARYTAGRDYHKRLDKRLQAFVRYLEALHPEAQCRTFVDTGPLLERAFAQRAGLGFIGKNTMLITRGLGSWVFLASILTTLDLPADAPDDRSCGDCRLCIEACPTQAITEPFHLDARRCIAYLTIEHRGPIAEEFREQTGPWVFGCDICQEVCPHNATRRGKPLALGLRDILSLKTPADFEERFQGSAFTRAGREGLMRNACLAAANLSRQDLKPLLEDLALAEAPLVQESARWALGVLERRPTSNPKSAQPTAPAGAWPDAANESRH